MTTTVRDGSGNEIVVGGRVHLHHDERDAGEVVSISDPDGDVDDEGRGYGIPPKVTVRFSGGEEDSFSAYDTATGPWDEGAWECDELVAVPA